jgi:PAS domain S-box-containing protein
MKEERIKLINQAIQNIAAGDFSTRIPISLKLDEIDGIATGINMLSEEVSAAYTSLKTEKDKLEKINIQLQSARIEHDKKEELFKKVFHTSPDVITISRLSNGTFIEVNKGFEENTGYSKEEVTGRSVFEIGLWTDTSIREKLMEMLMLDNKPQNIESTFRTKDGRLRKGLVAAALIDIGGDPHLLTVSRDITDIEFTREALKDTEKRYEELIRNAPNGIVVVNKTGYITMANPAFLNTSGYSKEEVIGKHFTRYQGFRVKEIPKYIKIFTEIIAGKVPSEGIEIEWKHKNGTIGFAEVKISLLHSQGQISGLQAMITDTSDRVRMLRELRSSEVQYRSSMDAMMDAICVINKDYRIVLANHALRQILQRMGLPGEVIGIHYRDAFPFHSRSIEEELLEVFRTGKTFRHEDSYRIGKHAYTSEIRLIPIYEGKKISRVLTIIQDITERKKTEMVQQIMYNISNAVNLTKDLYEFIHAIRKELGLIFDTTNFFIALYNKEDDTLSLPFFVDEKDRFESFPAKKSLTGYVIRNDRPLLMKDRDIRQLIKKGEVDDVGSPSKIWLGVPLKIREEIIGAVVVQHYEDESAYTIQDLEILKFVSTQIGMLVQTKRANDEVRLEKAYFEQLFHSSPEAIILTDIEGRLMRVNAAFEKFFGYTANEAIGRYIDQLIVPENLAEEAQSISRSVTHGEIVRTETLRKHKNGKLIDVAVLGTPCRTESGQIAVFGIYRDITERKQAERALKESEEKLRNILKFSPDAITVSDLRGRVTECNPASLKIFGMNNQDELIGISAGEFLVPEERPKGIIKIREVLRKGSIQNQEFALKVANGNNIMVELSASLIKDFNGKPTGIVTVTKDITERKNYEKNLKIAKEKAEESDRLKSAFLANMSHEIRTPMNAILGFSELLKSNDLTKDTREEYIKIINNKGHELLLLINDIIDISKIEAGDINIIKTDLSVNDLIRDLYTHVMEEKALMNREHLQIRLSIPQSVQAIINSDIIRLRQILTNLLNNALKFTKEGYIEIGYRIEKQSTIEFFVKDTGIGISEDKQDIIFDRFRQVDESISSVFGGTGLGLAISKNLVSLLGGNIRVKSKPGYGSTFYFRLPVKQIIPGKQSRETDSSDKKEKIDLIDLSGKTILVAEDDAANYYFIESLLKRTNASIKWAKDGFQAIDILKSNETYDLIFMDIRMPGMNGIDTTLKIRENDKQIPVIALTAYAFTNDRNAALRAGCNDYLSKPVTVKALSSILAKYMCVKNSSNRTAEDKQQT